MLEAGADAIKLFPAEVLGPPMLKALRAVLPKSAIVIPVGGVDANQVAPWMAAGALGLGVGSSIYKPGDDARVVEAKAGSDGSGACVHGVGSDEQVLGALRKSALPFVISTGAYPDFLLRALATTTCAALHEESRMQSLKATGLHRKSGERSGEISVWMRFLGNVFLAEWQRRFRVMKRRTFLRSLAATAIAGSVRSSARLRCSAPQNEDYPGACLSATES